MMYSDSDHFVKMVGARLKEIRKSQGLTQREVGMQAGLEETAVQRIEAGRVNSTLKTLVKIVNVLNVEFSSIFIFGEID